LYWLHITVRMNFYQINSGTIIIEIFFDNEKNSRKIRDLAVVHNVHRHQDNKFPNEHTDPIILNYQNDSQYQIAM